MANYRRVSALEIFSRSIEVSNPLAVFGIVKGLPTLNIEDEVVKMALRQRASELESQLEAKELKRKIVLERIAEYRRLAAEDGIVLEN